MPTPAVPPQDSRAGGVDIKPARPEPCPESWMEPQGIPRPGPTLSRAGDYRPADHQGTPECPGGHPGKSQKRVGVGHCPCAWRASASLHPVNCPAPPTAPREREKGGHRAQEAQGRKEPGEALCWGVCTALRGARAPHYTRNTGVCKRLYNAGTGQRWKVTGWKETNPQTQDSTPHSRSPSLYVVGGQVSLYTDTQHDLRQGPHITAPLGWIPEAPLLCPQP